VDALFFFGREKDSQVIAANLIASRLTVLFGPTGVGKTSVLRAGVAHRLRQEAGADVRVHSSWIDDPVEVLEALEQSDAVDLYLILDQFEEFFLYHEGDRTFAAALAETVRRPDLRVNVLIGIREDALALLDGFKAAIPTLLSNRLRLENLDRGSGAAAIRGPLSRFNELVPAERAVELEPDLVDDVLDQVAAGRVEVAPVGRGVVTAAAEPNRIEAPYLQLVMSRLWEVETTEGSSTLRRSTLEELGGATRIVENHLERAMAELSVRQKDAAAAMYNFLVTPSGTKIAHKTSDLAGYAQIEEWEAADVLQRLAAERIVRASAENGASIRYEIYHDVLADAVAAWRNRHRSEQTVREAEQRRRRALTVATAALILLILVTGVAVFALVERGRSRAQARRAHARELAASAVGELDTNPRRGVALAARAAVLEPGAGEEEALRAALLADTQLAVMRAGGPVIAARFDPLGRHVATGSTDGSVRIYRVGASTPEQILSQGGPVTSVEYAADGTLMSAGRDGSVKLWRPRGSLIRKLNAAGPVRSAFFGRNGTLVAAIAASGLIRIWDVRTGTLRLTIPVEGRAVPHGGSIDPLGRTLVTFGSDRFARVYSLQSGALLRVLRQNGRIHCAAFSSDTTKVMTCGHEGLIQIWSAATGRRLQRLRGPELGSAILDGVFSPRGRLVAGAVSDGTGRVWESVTGLQVGVMFGHSNPTTKIAFNSTGKAVVTGSPDNRARTWLTNGKPVAILAGHTAAITSVSFSPNGRMVLTASDDGTARLWDSGTEPNLRLVARQPSPTTFAVSTDGHRVATGDARGVVRVRRVGGNQPISTLHVHGPVTALAFGPTGPIAATAPTLSVAVARSTQTIARGLRDGTIRLRMSPNSPVRVLRTGGGAVTAIAFNADGTLLAAGDSRGVTRTYQLPSGSRARNFYGHRAAITSLAFSPEGALLTASVDHEARLWDTATGVTRRVIRWHFGPLASARFSPDGRWIITAGPSTAGVGLVSTGRRILLLRGHSRPLVGAAFTGSDGETIVTASKDGTIRLYRCGICGGVDKLLQIAARRLREGRAR
jgi:WD40 repeat protein